MIFAQKNTFIKIYMQLFMIMKLDKNKTEKKHKSNKDMEIWLQSDWSVVDVDVVKILYFFQKWVLA